MNNLIHITFLFQNLRNAEKIKTDVDRLLLVLIMKNNFLIYFVKFDLFRIWKPKVVYLRPFLSSLILSKFWKRNSMYTEKKMLLNQ